VPKLGTLHLTYNTWAKSSGDTILTVLLIHQLQLLTISRKNLNPSNCVNDGRILLQFGMSVISLFGLFDHGFWSELRVGVVGTV
jgi:hypothetical protein